jgi:paraquat-inducible protein A
MSASTAAAAPHPALTRLRACPDCGLIQHLPALPRGALARCPRCAAILRRRRIDPTGRALALALTGLLLLLLATTEPLLDVSLRGRELAAGMFSGPMALEQHGMWPLALAVLATTIAAPLGRLAALAYVLLGLGLKRPPRHLYAAFRIAGWFTPWAMAEVFLLGLFVAYTKLIDFARVDVGLAVYALGGLTLVTALAASVLDEEAIWQGLEGKGVTAGPPAGERRGPLFGCDSCGLVSHATLACPRCGTAVRPRRPASLARTTALLAAAAILYVPANVLPVMTVVSLGSGAPSTILSGVIELAQDGMWPLAALVFFASITVPVLKVLSLGWLLVSTHRGSAARLRERTTLYRIVDAIGRWSMIDVFMISILTALLRLGFLVSVNPGPGAVAFCAVVILTMLAAQAFDPRLMWDAAGQNRR